MLAIKDFNSFCTLFNTEQLILWGYFNLLHYLKIKYNNLATNLMGYSKLGQGAW